MPVAPTGIIGLPRQYLANLIAATSAFQSWTNEGTPTLAKTRIYFYKVSDLVADDRPYAIVGKNAVRVDGISSPTGSSGNGEIPLMFYDDLVTTNDVADELHTFENNVGAILQEMDTLKHQAQGGDIVLSFNDIEPDGDTLISDADENSNIPQYINAVWIVRYSNALVT